MKMHKNRYHKEQWAALCHLDGPALVIAGPGSGKTTTLLGRISFLIQEKHIPPSQLLVITYTKEAAASMQKRFITENPEGASVTFGTFHAIFYHILKTEYSLQTDCLLSTQEKKSYLLPILKKYEIDIRLAEEMLYFITMRKNGEKTAEKLSLSVEEETKEAVFREYVAVTRKNGRIDFEDMLLLTRKLFREREDILEKWRERFRYILVDEFQDTNRIQYELLRMLAAPDNHIFAVGDDDQSIYGFRGATPAILKRFLTDYPAAETYYLQNNYRSGKEIVRLAGRIISENKDRLLKKPAAMKEDTGDICIKAFTEVTEEYRYFAIRIRNLKEENNNLGFEDFAILCRTNREAENVRAVLGKENIPCACRKGKEKTEEGKEDMLSYLRLSEGKGSRADFLRIMNKPDRGLSRVCIPEEEVDFIRMERWCLELKDEAGAGKIRTLHKQLQTLRKMPEELKISYIQKGIGYERYMGKKPPDTAKDGVQVLTMHAAKGLEFYYVGIPNVQEGRIPYGKILSGEQEEEERRLFYVAVTRAKKILDILYLKGTKERPGLLSRFVRNEGYSSEGSTSSSNS